MTGLILLVVISTGIWVYFDAWSIGTKMGQAKGTVQMNAISWLLGCLLLWIVAFPMYLIKRGKFKRIIEQQQIASNQPQQSSGSALEQIEKLATMKEKGIITEAEFNAKKKSLLGV